MLPLQPLRFPRPSRSPSKVANPLPLAVDRDRALNNGILHIKCRAFLRLAVAPPRAPRARAAATSPLKGALFTHSGCKTSGIFDSVQECAADRRA